MMMMMMHHPHDVLMMHHHHDVLMVHHENPQHKSSSPSSVQMIKSSPMQVIHFLDEIPNKCQMFSSAVCKHGVCEMMIKQLGQKFQNPNLQSMKFLLNFPHIHHRGLCFCVKIVNLYLCICNWIVILLIITT